MIWGNIGQSIILATSTPAAAATTYPGQSFGPFGSMPEIVIAAILIQQGIDMLGFRFRVFSKLALAVALVVLCSSAANAAGPPITTLLVPNPAAPSSGIVADGNSNVIAASTAAAGTGAAGTYLPQINLRTMASGDVVEYRAFKRANTGDGTVTGETYGSGTGSQTQFNHALGNGLTGMTLNQTGVTSGTTGSVVIATPPAGYPIIGQFYVLNPNANEWAIAQFIDSTHINLLSRNALGTTAAAWTTGDPLTIANQAAQPGSVVISAPSAVVSTDTPGFGNPNTSGAPNGLSGVCGGTGIASGIIDYANGAVSITFSAAPASGTNNITVAYNPLYLVDYYSFANVVSTPIPPFDPIPTQGAIMFTIKQIPNAINGSITGRTFQYGVVNLSGN